MISVLALIPLSPFFVVFVNFLPHFSMIPLLLMPFVALSCCRVSYCCCPLPEINFK
jgi:hypothetical protein